MNFQEMKNFIPIIDETALSRAFKAKNSDSKLNLHFLKLVLTYQKIIINRFLKFESPKEDQLDYQDILTLFLLLFCGNLSEKNILAVSKENKGLEVIFPFSHELPDGYAEIRKFELAAAINRLRSLRTK